MDEFEIIRRFFFGQSLQRNDVRLGIGDDAAILRVPPGQELVVSVDSLVASVHFPEDLQASAIGHRALAVNLSDLAAMGATPVWALLALSLPSADEGWISEFARGFFALAERYQVALVGGNLARGPLNITVTVHGFVPSGRALLRTGAQPGDQLCVTGWLGDAADGLQRLQAHMAMTETDTCMQRFCFPEPRIQAGLVLRDIASSAIDISDGLAADLGHLLQASGAGAQLQIDQLPLSSSLLQHRTQDQAVNLALSGGDDYELCFTVPTERMPLLESHAREFGCPVKHIGEITTSNSLQYLRNNNTDWPLPVAGYKHF
ncbi:MAG TPA: thiamine-phosphate kinase [Gammaproteobacteria bacterium]|nr:thiamine-phosphate kinase [Gammaproteobacteria bacterium]